MKNIKKVIIVIFTIIMSLSLMMMYPMVAMADTLDTEIGVEPFGCPDNEHTWDAGVVTKEPTELSTGTKKFTCTTCGSTKTETIPALAHTHNYKTAVTNPTCDAQGYTTYACACGYSYTANYTAALGHSWGNWTNLNETEHQRVCAHDKNHVEKANHSWGAGVGTKEATETETGVRTFTCTACKATREETIPKLEHVHKYQTTVTNPTCDAQGYTTYACACGYSYTANYTAALGHSWGNWTNLNETEHQRVCTHDKNHIEKANHSWGAGVVTKEATETETGVRTFTCTVCKATRAETIPVIPHSHKYIATVTKPTCDVQGYTTYTCSCGESYKADYTDALGHSWGVGVVTKEATETETGVRTFTCTRCGETRAETIPVLTHTHNYTKMVIAPTCIGEGYTTYTCSCGDSYKDDYTDALGHSWGIGVVTKKATETETGVRTFTCTVCKATRTETIPVLTHTHNYTKVVTAPTCIGEGYTTYTCSCGDSYKDDYTDALGHSWGIGVVTKEATEEETGILTYTCTVCGETKEEVIPVATHVHQYIKKVTKPTCTKKGYTTYTCSCGDNYKDDYVAALGHTHKVTKATLTKNGKISGTCSVCDKKIKSNKTIYAVDTVKLSYTSTTYNGKTKAPSVTVKDTKGKKLTKGTDYTVTYAKGRKNVGSYKVTVKGTGNYSFTKTLTFKIKAAGIDSAKLSYTSTTYNGKAKKPSVTVVDKNGNKLTKSTDYTVKYDSGRKKVGSYKVTVKGTGNYSFTKELTFKIKAAGIDSAKLSYTSYTYTGKVKKPSVTVTDKNGNKLKSGTDYTVKYADGRKNVGTYKVTVKGKGNYSFTKTLTFKINPAKATLSSVTKKSNTSITVKWKKVSNVTGYQIKYAKEDGTYKTVKVKGASTVSKVLTGLTEGETYDISIRTYKTVSGTTYYSGYSAAKSAELPAPKAIDPYELPED